MQLVMLWLKFHRQAIDRRRELGSDAAALHDKIFLDSLYETLQKWGIGRRASHLVDRLTFELSLLSQESEISILEQYNIEEADFDVDRVGVTISNLIGNLGVVTNVSKIVAGSKALHHILPDLVPPLDRKWSGLFFKWSPSGPQNELQRVFGEAFRSLALVAVTAKPSRLIDSGWNSSSTKFLDNGLIGFCQLELA